MKKNTVRIIALVIASALCWYFSVGYSHELFHVLTDREIIKPADSYDLVVDGTDFTPFMNIVFKPFMNIMATGTNSLISFIINGTYILLTTLFIALFTVILRFAVIRKTDHVAQSEVKFTRNFIIISSVLAFAAGIFVSNIRLACNVFLLSWQQPLFMFLIYYLALRKRANEESRKQP